MENILYHAYLMQMYKSKVTYTLFPYFSAMTGDLFDAQNIAGHIATTIVPLVNALQNEGVENILVKCWASQNPSGSYSHYLTGGGTYTATEEEWLPPYVSLGIRWTPDLDQYGERVQPITRGYTRISGLSDSQFYSGRIENSVVNADVVALATARQAVYSNYGRDYFPCIHVNHIGAGDTWRVAQIVGMNGYRASTQNTRKLSF